MGTGYNDVISSQCTTSHFTADASAFITISKRHDVIYIIGVFISDEHLISGTHVGPPVEELVLRDRLEGVRRPRDVVRVAAVGDLVAREARRARSACKTTREIEGAEIQNEEMPELDESEGETRNLI